MSKPFSRSLVSLALALGLAPAASAVNVNVDGQVIADSSFWDMDPAPNAVRFDSTDSLQGFSTASGIDAKGDVQILGPGGALTSIVAGPRLVLTNFVADRPTTLGPNPVSFQITFDHAFTQFVQGVLTAADIVQAFQDDGTSAPVFAQSAAQPSAFGEDSINFWQGYVNSIPIPVPFGPAPAIPSPAGLGNPYPLYGHGASVMMILPGALIQPTLQGDLNFTLGGSRNQFILTSSAEVGFEIPEPATGALVAAGVIALAAARRSRRAGM